MNKNIFTAVQYVDKSNVIYDSKRWWYMRKKVHMPCLVTVQEQEQLFWALLLLNLQKLHARRSFRFCCVKVGCYHARDTCSD